MLHGEDTLRSYSRQQRNAWPHPGQSGRRWALRAPAAGPRRLPAGRRRSGQSSRDWSAAAFVQTQRVQALRRGGHRLATKFEEDGDNRQEPVDQRQDRLCLFDTAADQAARRCLYSMRDTTQPKRPGNLFLEPMAHVGWGPASLLRRQCDPWHVRCCLAWRNAGRDTSRPVPEMAGPLKLRP
jgi:hypothetical protein